MFRPQDDDDSAADDDDSAADDDDSGAPSDCEDVWQIPDGSAFFVVDAAAGPGGDGSLEAPFADLQTGLEAVRNSEARFLALKAGSYAPLAPETRFSLGGSTDDQLTLAGCGPETVIEAVTSSGDLQSVLEILGSAEGLSVRDLTVRGGRRSVIVRDGAGALDPVRLERVRVEDSVRLGIAVTGLGTQLELADVVVDGVTSDEDGALGYGVVAWDSATLAVTGGEIREATGAGLVLDAAAATVSGLSVSSTRVLQDGSFGRGVQIQSGSSVELQGVSVTDNSDAGIFVLQAGPVSVTDSTVERTQSVPVQGVKNTLAGAGLVATSNILVDPGSPPDEQLLILSGNSFVQNQRLGAIVEGYGLVAQTSLNEFTDNILPDEDTFPLDDRLYVQLGAEVESGSPDFTAVPDGLEQVFFRELLPLDSLP